MTTVSQNYADNQNNQKNHYSAWWMLLLGSLTALGPLAIDMYLPAIPAMATSFATTTETASYSVTFYFIGMVFGQLLYGPLSDRFGRKTPLYFGLSLYIIGSAVCALALSFDVLIAARLVQAIGGTAGVVIARAAIRDKLSTNMMAQAFSTLMMVMGLAPILAPSMGDIILSFGDWRWIFWILTVIGLINLLVVVFFFKDSLPVHKRKPMGFWQVFKEYRLILLDKRFTLPALASGAMLGALFVYIGVSAGLMIEHFKLSPTQYSWVFGINSLGFVLMGQVNVRLIKKYSLDTLFFTGAMLFFGFMCCLLVAVLTDLATFTVTWLLLFLAIATIGITGPNGTTMALAHQSERAGIASSMLGGLRFFMGVVGGGFLYLLPLPLLTEMALVMILLASTGVFLMFVHRKLHTVSP